MSRLALLTTLLIFPGLGLALPAAADQGADHDAQINWSCTEDDRDIRLLHGEHPYYPHSAMMFCLTGKVDAGFTVDRNGTTRDIRIIDSEPGAIFDRATVGAIEQWRFVPACRDGALAEWEAVQSIVFELPSEAMELCNQRHAHLDSEGMALLSEVGARYALLAQYAQQQYAWQDIEPAITAPFASFDGDLGEVAAFHQQALATLTPSQMTNELAELSEYTTRMLQPHAIAANPDLEQANQQLEAHRTALDEWLDQSQAVYTELAEAYQRLSQQTGLDQSTLDLLVTAFLGNFEMGFDEVVEPEIETLARAQAIVDFLDARRSGWQAVGHTIQFDRVEDAEAWQSLWNDLHEHQAALQSEEMTFLRSFEDYNH